MQIFGIGKSDDRHSPLVHIASPHGTAGLHMVFQFTASHQHEVPVTKYDRKYSILCARDL